MSFLSVLRTVGLDALKVIGVATGPIGSAVVGITLGPAATAILNRINGAVIGAEAIIQGVQQGVAKQASVATIVSSELPTLEGVIQELGPGVTFPEAELNAAISASANMYTAIAALVAAAKKPAAPA